MVCAMRKAKVLSILFVVVLLAVVVVAEAQQAEKIPRIGFLSAASLASVAARVDGFRQGLRELGYVQGKNVVIEWRHAEGKPDCVREFAAELVRLKVREPARLGPPRSYFCGQDFERHQARRSAGGAAEISA
jgi:ABC-type uncharacterized transport system substrate-binding protein